MLNSIWNAHEREWMQTLAGSLCPAPWGDEFNRVSKSWGHMLRASIGKYQYNLIHGGAQVQFYTAFLAEVK